MIMAPILDSSYCWMKKIRLETKCKARAAAGSDARMSGCPLPVVICSGSGTKANCICTYHYNC